MALDHVRVAIIGAGSMANQVHYPSLTAMQDVSIVGICDLNPVRLQATADKYSIEARYSDYRQMIEDQAPDAVYVIGQPNIMYDIWTWCLQHGLNLYIEKPMGTSLHQARTLAYLAEKHGCITQVSFQRRTCPIAVKLRDACLTRGPIVHTLCRFYKCQLNPYLDARDHMFDDGVHAIDTLRWACGGEVVGVQSQMKRVQTPDYNFISALIEFDNGSTGLLVNSWSSGRRIFALEMHAPGICAEVELENKGYLYADGDTRGTEYDTRQVAGSDQFYVYGGFAAKNRDFIDAVKYGRLPSSHFGDALKTIEVAEVILAQALLHS
ncbi:MAG: Gfo/Idh/MocA family protein [Anaerolineae bacterium]